MENGNEMIRIEHLRKDTETYRCWMTSTSQSKEVRSWLS